MAAKNVQLPELGEGVAEGELVKWLVKVGDTVAPDQPVAEMMTDKATVEVPSPFAGVVKEILKKEGDIVEVGHVMLTLESDGSSTAETSPASHHPASTPSAVAPVAAATAVVAASAASSGGAGAEFYPPATETRVLATPSTRRLARESGVDLNRVPGSGIAGRVTRDDVLAATGAGAVSAGQPVFNGTSALRSPVIPRPAYQGPAGATEERVPLRGIRKKIAENMQMAKHIVPHFTLMDEANVTALVQMREELRATAEKTGVKVTYLPFVMKALIATMRDFPMFNASIDDAAQEIVYKKYFNIGFAADTPNGLLVPVIKNADQKTILEISREIIDLATRARDGKLALDEMRGATVTITNIGSVGGQYATPIINHPEVAIFGMYKIQERPIIQRDADGGMTLDAIKTMGFTVTADHRLIDGAVAANFLKAFIGRIENPGALMLDMM